MSAAEVDMLDRIKSFFFREMAPPNEEDAGGPSAEDLRIAACALLLEVAHADDHFSAGERRHLRDLVRRHFGLRAEAAAELIVVAEYERQRRTDLWGFAKLVKAHYSTGQKLVLAGSHVGSGPGRRQARLSGGLHHEEDLPPCRAQDRLSGGSPKAT